MEYTTTTFRRPELVRAYHRSIINRMVWGISRNVHEAVSRDVAEQLIKSVFPLPLKYDREKRNCDEFAEMLRYQVWQQTGWRGLGLVCDYKGRHWYNVALLELDGRPDFELVESQTGDFVKPGDKINSGGDASYDCQRGWVML